MAEIKPFRGWRYSPGVGPLDRLVTPPYDVIDAAAQEEYYRRHPYNIIRLEYGKVYPEDTEENNRYTRAAAYFKAWREDKVLVPEDQPALYLYEQEFTIKGSRLTRTGLICRVKLEPYKKGIILPHEETLPRHKADRLALLRACEANFSPIFGLYMDPERQVEEVLRRALTYDGQASLGVAVDQACFKGIRRPDVEFTDEDGQVHRLWVIMDPWVLNQVEELLAPKRIFIADGHHRYETALAYQRERREQEGFSTGERPYDYVLMTLVNLYDPGLVILPTHRLVRNLENLDEDSLLEGIKEHFTIEPFPLAPDYSNFSEFLKKMEEKGGLLPEGVAEEKLFKSPRFIPHGHAFGLYCGKGRLYLLTLREEHTLSSLMPTGPSPAWKGLDVSVLHYLILEKLLGIGGAERAKERYLTYTREEEGALRAVDAGEYQLAFFLNPTRVEEVIAVAEAGEKMPQKSTYFYPKLITGLVINSLEE